MVRKVCYGTYFETGIAVSIQNSSNQLGCNSYWIHVIIVVHRRLWWSSSISRDMLIALMNGTKSMQLQALAVISATLSPTTLRVQRMCSRVLLSAMPSHWRIWPCWATVRWGKTLKYVSHPGFRAGQPPDNTTQYSVSEPVWTQSHWVVARRRMGW